MNNLSDFTIHHKTTIREAFKQETINKGGCVIVVDDNNNPLFQLYSILFRNGKITKESGEHPYRSLCFEK